MKNLSLTFCLAIATLLASVGSGFALPKCKGSPTDNNLIILDLNWNNCTGILYGPFSTYVGEFQDVYFDGQGTETFKSGEKYIGEFKMSLYNGQGIYYYRNGNIEEGVWKSGKFQYAQKTPYSRKPSILRTTFKKLSKPQRKQLQSNLKDLGFYELSIDGLYGKGTAGALTAYNKQNLNGADLKKSENVEKLFNVVLGFEPSPTIIPETKPKVTTDFQPTHEIEPTTKVEPKLVPKVQPKPKPK